SYRSLSRLDINYFLNVDEGAVMGLSPSELPNYNLKWETTDQYNAGVDLGILKNRLNFTFDVYYKLTKDMLLQADVPGQSGSFKQWQNIGKVENKGVEFSLNSLNISTNNFSWRTNFNISANRNKILSLGEVSSIPVSISDGVINEIARLKVGEAIGSGWGYVFDGIYQTSDFNEDGSLKDGIVSIKGVNSKPGDVKFKSLNEDNEVDPVNDKTVISRSEPKFFGGLTNSFEYKDFFLSAFFHFSYGNEVINIGRWKYEGYSAYYNITEDYYKNSWSETNPSNSLPAIKGAGKNESSSYYVEDASFIRLQNLSFGYNIPFKHLKPIGINSCQLSLSIDNLLLLTKYTGFDPEVSYWNRLITGLDNVTYPRSRSFSLGININL
ncbi:MAG: TonB-dependent receptor, partial [Tissierellia bacterium]|nr:TonB-dependent receptor [Tissierellia bacterium]